MKTSPQEILADYNIHPAAELFPLMDKAELRELSADIKAHGLIHPIVQHEGQILDGRNRLVACLMADIAAEFIEWEPNGSPTEWVLSVNLKRRQLTASQRAAVATESLPLLEAEAKARQGARNDIVEIVPPSVQGKARDKAAAAVNVNPRYVSDAKAIKEASPETFQKVLAGEVSIPQAKKQIWDAGAIATRPEEHEPEDDDSDGLWNLKQCWRKANKKEKAAFLKWVEEHGPKSN
jgi:hypothetical protein